MRPLRTLLFAAGLAISGSLLAAAAPPPEVLPWIENDYPKALAKAKTTHHPIFVEAWAPW